jgi:hypothetical protein
VSGGDYLTAEKQLLDKIRTRGHWRVVFRPQVFKQRITSLKQLFVIVEEKRVDMGGWRFPFIPDHPSDLKNGQRHIDKDWVGQIHVWEHHLEAWRCYSSGQFSCITSMPWDWRDQSGWWPAEMTPGWKPNAVVGILHIAQMVSQALEFFVRLGETPLGDEQLHFEIVLGHVQNRQLFPDSPRRILGPDYRSNLDSIPVQRDISRAELIARLDDVTAESISEIFSGFDFKVAPSVLDSLIAEVRGERGA